MRIRTIKPEFWQNERLAALPAETRLLAIGLLNYADDAGYFRANPALIRAAIFPFQEHYRNITVALRELSTAGFIDLGKDENGNDIGKICKFEKHQYINHPQPSKIRGFKHDSGNVTVTVPECSGNATIGIGNGNREQGKDLKEKEKKENVACATAPHSKKFQKPTLEEVTAYCRERSNAVSPQAFLDFYESKGWKVGDQPMRDWQAAVRTWERRDNRGGTAIQKPTAEKDYSL